MEYFIWCDESVKKGRINSNFYGGVLVPSTHVNKVAAAIQKVCAKQNLHHELKWQNVSAPYLEKYKAVMSIFFRQLKAGKVKVRIMYRQTAHVAKGLNKNQSENEFFLLYYQFFKHAFGLEHSNHTNKPIYIRAYFDLFPDTIAKSMQFKEYIKGLESLRKFQLAKIKFRKEDITEVKSHDHILLQCLDIVLGSMAFRLNNMHKEKPEGQRRRGKRTIAKEKLYKYINTQIRELYPNFNIGASTGVQELSDRWKHPYRHWNFKPKDFEVDETAYK
jgi:hypothetical protein